jgi:diguanylate cyclase (GGDEF)-like protein
VDDLKRINDSRGHAAGDRTLKQVAAILRKCFRDSDIVARIGGDEFVALIVDATEQDPQRYRERLDRQCGRLNARTKGQQPLSMSIGTFRCDPDASCTIEDLLDRADRSMYRHKSKRRIAQR